MRDHELEQATRQSVGLRQTEESAEADPVRDHHPDHRQSEHDAEREREDRDIDVVHHDQSRHLHPLLLRDLRPELVMMHPIDQPGVGDGVGGVGIREDYEEGDQRRHEHQRAGGEEVRPCLAISARKGLDVEALDPFPHLSAAAIDDAVAARHEPVQVTLHGLTRPVALRASQVGCRSPVQRGHGQHLGGGERVEVARVGAREQVLEPVPVLAPHRHEVFRPQWSVPPSSFRASSRPRQPGACGAEGCVKGPGAASPPPLPTARGPQQVCAPSGATLSLPPAADAANLRRNSGAKHSTTITNR